MRIAVFPEASSVIGGIEVLARCHEAELGAAGYMVEQFGRIGDTLVTD